MSNRVINHQRFDEVVGIVRDAYIRSTKGEPVIQPVFGLSGVGKSFSIRIISQMIRANGRDEVLEVEFPQMRSYRAVIDECLTAFRLSPRAYRNEAQAMEGLARQVAAKNVKLIIFDESQNLLERKHGINPRAMADTIKQIFNKCEVSIAVFGMPDAQQLFKSNEQLARRSLAPFRFYPYEWTGREFKNFRSALAASIQYMHSLNIETFELSNLDFAKRMYVASSGRVALSEKLVKEVVGMGVNRAFLEEFEKAYTRSAFSFFVEANPFTPSRLISEQDMASSYLSAMREGNADV
ncbi:ATP-binding protein [Metapseudomonas furukawaii]|uniref:ATP-binding protein n=1 Tax=Metapseudomonas furukawaii TaxID=1149133 RepID=UPI00227D348E|nr:ATP-binding protein [Pseudomonas furukawaii]WAG79133.1 ATP-binding protein [Pseudomonas furukawaii]